MDLSTTYLGLKLPHPLMPGASPLVDDLDTVRRLEDAGAAAIVMHSLFEEQVERSELGMVHGVLVDDPEAPEALAQFPRPEDFPLGPDEYLEQLRRIKATVGVPVSASLNGTTRGGWLRYAQLIEEAGADALELNMSHVSADARDSGADVERRLLEVVRQVRWKVTLPIAVKLSPFYSSLPHVASALDQLGVNGLVLFNRFYQPDIDPEMLLAVPKLTLSTPEELTLRLRWIAILYGRVEASLAASGGVHTGLDVVKTILAGAHAVQVVSALLTRGPAHLVQLRKELARWLEVHDYESLRHAQGELSLIRCAEPEAFERGNYLRILQTWVHPRRPLRHDA
jgi:dihydroorotate dehydrogenase (fumarate)